MNYENDRDPWHFLIGMNGSETDRQRMAASLMDGYFDMCGGARIYFTVRGGVGLKMLTLSKTGGSGSEFQLPIPFCALSRPPPVHLHFRAFNSLSLLPFSGLTVLADSGLRCFAIS
jgi:hypothetical protein